MRPLVALPSSRALALRGLVFDLDDTFLVGGALDARAFEALCRMREAGIELFACTGRPALWAELALRQWPIDAAIAENGALVYVRGGGRVERIDRVGREERRQRRAALLAIAARLVEHAPGLELADDNEARITDVTIDVGEHASVAPSVVRELELLARASGARTFTSSVHLHLTFDADDKASGAIRAIGRVTGVGATEARASFAYVGDSGNDAAAFAAFECSVGVANVRSHLRRLSVPPRWVAKGARAEGFCELASILLDAKIHGPSDAGRADRASAC
ncbi:MAG: HAD-IIB family hydrolase [Polyangiaceae bacterium]